MEEAVGAFVGVVRILHHHRHRGSDSTLWNHAVAIAMDVVLAPFVATTAKMATMPAVATIVAKAIVTEAAIAGAIGAAARTAIRLRGLAEILASVDTS